MRNALLGLVCCAVLTSCSESTTTATAEKSGGPTVPPRETPTGNPTRSGPIAEEDLRSLVELGALASRKEERSDAGGTSKQTIPCTFLPSVGGGWICCGRPGRMICRPGGGVATAAKQTDAATSSGRPGAGAVSEADAKRMSELFAVAGENHEDSNANAPATPKRGTFCVKMVLDPSTPDGGGASYYCCAGRRWIWCEPM